jgi:hypothetical protein
MVFSCKQVVAKYKTLIAEMSKDQIENEATRSNLQKLLDLELIFGLHCILSLLELVQTLIKYTQGKDVYICDFVEAIKMCKVKLYELYIYHECKFKDETFNAFHSLLVGKHDGLPLLFIKSLTIDDDWCAIKSNGHTILVRSWDQIVGVVLLMNLTLFFYICGSIQLECLEEFMHFQMN